MSNFFEKLKKGMGIDEESVGVRPQHSPQPFQKKPVKKISKKKLQKLGIKAKLMEIKVEPIKLETKKIKKIESSTLKSGATGNEEKEKPPTTFIEKKSSGEFEKERNLSGTEGQLTVDVYQTKNDLVIQSAIAGIKAEDLDISIENDTLIIKGDRRKPDEKEQDYFTKECYWGVFSKKIILPVEVDPSRIAAKMKQGILTISLPKIEREKKRKVVVKE